MTKLVPVAMRVIRRIFVAVLIVVGLLEPADAAAPRAPVVVVGA